MRVYLDVCCLNRPFDDQTQGRVCLETVAVMAVLERVQQQGCELVSSEAIEFENTRNPRQDVQEMVADILGLAGCRVAVGAQEGSRARELAALGFGSYDALHVACAESAGAAVLLTTDDRFIRCAERHATKLRVQVCNPVAWVTEVEE